MTKNAFTLSEVLITLGIIGVVAAITMPTLIQNYKKQVTITQLKKAYSEFSQAMQKAEAEHGLMETWNFADFETQIEGTKYFGENYIFPYIKIVKKCIPTSSECWADEIYNLNNVETNSSMSNKYSTTKAVSFISASGYSGFFWVGASGSNAWYFVDLNGNKKGPNMLGKDIFGISMNFGSSTRKLGYHVAGLNAVPTPTRDELMAGKFENGTSILGNSDYACRKDMEDKSKKPYGVFCGAIIVLDGWKIENDYPW